MTSEVKIREAADRLWQAWESGTPGAPVRDLLGEGDVAAAYAVQEINTTRWLDAGRKLSGRKIGLTSVAVQRQLGVGQPDYGMLFSDMEVMDGEEVAWDRVQQPRVEAEIAYVLGAPLAGAHLTMVDLIGAIAYALPAIEIVGSRVAAWDIGITDTVADNASSGLYVLGQSPRSLADFDQRLCGMVMTCGGEPVSVGAGAACMGSPLNASLWLARTMAAAGRPLGPGDVILSGALGPFVAAKPGDVFEARINGLGSVRAAFAKG
ncbi:fumarylacetoacetate hydrolase family protein [Salipiger sp. P9]|uniref:2-keto-4-pentenoate hydratase n=1 Tax=Salipiger pentaromativorans TaxID=2943193 RepID=UPI002157FD6C|nr:fumarylacetoacetate hydrolase family protein [Salipiger pentaromativorans]MCR8547412.1 fumarylacetoacetate hydrolase family protein [Salipiger pentaromativorans]